MISIIQCHGCVNLDFSYKTGVASAHEPCHGCYITTDGTPSNYEPARFTVTSVQPTESSKVDKLEN